MAHHEKKETARVQQAPKVLTAEQASRLLDAAKGSSLEALFVLAIATGLSRGEVVALRWSDIDLSRQTLTVRRTVSWNGKLGYVERQPKTPARRRHIPLPGIACDALRHHSQHQEQEEHQVPSQGYCEGLVFQTAEGTCLEAPWLTEALAQLLRQAELPHLGFHNLRHTTASLLLMAGVSPFVVQQVLGLSTIRTPVQTLSPLPPALLVEAMNTMDRLLGRVDPDTTPDIPTQQQVEEEGQHR